MAIENMSLLQIVGSLEEMHSILKKLILCENVHLNRDTNIIYTNNYLVHQYESNIFYKQSIEKSIDYGNIEVQCNNNIEIVKDLCDGLNIELKIDKEYLADDSYSFEKSKEDLIKLETSIGKKSIIIKNKKNEIEELQSIKEKVECIHDKSINFNSISDLNYFNYEIGSLSSENKWRLKKNYENLSAIVLRIGIIKSSVEDMYITIFPKNYREETNNLLKSLNWNKLTIPEEFNGNPTEIVEKINLKIQNLINEIEELSNEIELDKEENKYILYKIYNTIILEQEIINLIKNIDYGDNLFIFNAWTETKNISEVKKAIGSITNKFIITEKKPEELGYQLCPPTKLKNNWFTKPFEIIVKMYGLPSYKEIDPTPFLAITFCLMFGIMFGDIGQGLVYFLAGLFLSKKMKDAGSILMRLGGSSIIFGFVYGSLFGLEQAELSWLPSLIGKPLDPKNIPLILLTGVIFGIIVLTISFVFGIINALKRNDLEEGLFGKNGLAGYLFFMSMVMTAVSITGIINLSIFIPVIILILCLVIMVLKVPITNLILNKSPLIPGEVGAYFTESIFEGVETILNALSNGISFIRVGAFALNHAGLFLAFLVMSELTENLIFKILILTLGNILIMTLEGLVVFIQGLRLEYYEMFSKYFNGDGIEYQPIKLNRL